jgi:hypothetical protein
MKIIKKILLVSTITAISTGAYAELQSLNDVAMSQVTGQAGLSIDIETKRHTGEFAYKDGGYIVMQNFSFGGNTSAEELAFSGGHGFFDNRRYEVDVAGSGALTADNRLGYGFSDMIDFAKTHTGANNTDAAMLLAAGITTGIAIDDTTGLEIDTRKTYGDGDLVIHFTHTDAWQKGGGYEAYRTTGGDDGAGGSATLDTLSYDSLRDVVWRGLDWNVSMEGFGLASSDYEVGSRGLLDASPKTTTLISDWSMNAYSGGWDISIKNNGNRFGADGSGHDGLSGSGNADSKIHFEGYYEVTDLDYYIDIAGVQINDVKLHNRRGDLGGLNRNSDDSGYTSSFGMLHFKNELYAVKDTVLNIASTERYVDGIAYNVHYKGDIDVGAISFGDTGVSIGKIYYTDLEVTNNYTISAH